MTAGILDYGIVVIILLLAWYALFDDDQFQSIIYFVAMGLVVALAWVRLDAPDVAIAEAAIGAGITGALLLITWCRLEQPAGEKGAVSTIKRVCTILLSLALATIMLLIVETFEYSPGLAGQIDRQLPDSGVSHPVTAVLLNFRSFDTLLEIGVLFLTLVAVRALGLPMSFPSAHLTPSPMLSGLLRMVVPVSILVGTYLLWTGSSSPGGAFQAGAVWGGALVLMRLAGSDLLEGMPGDWSVWIGLAVFSLAAVGAFLITGGILTYPPQQAGIWILLIEIAASLSIALTLYLLFSLGYGPQKAGHRSSRRNT